MRLNGDEKLIFEEFETNIDNPIYIHYNSSIITVKGNTAYFMGRTFKDIKSLYDFIREDCNG